MRTVVAQPAPKTHPAQVPAPSGPSSLQEHTAHQPSSAHCCLPPSDREGMESLCTPSAAPPQPELGHLLSEVKGNSTLQQSHASSSWTLLPPPHKAFLIRESCMQALHFVPIGVLGLVAACMILQESQVCQVPGGSWHEADRPCVVPHQQSEDISPLQLSHHLHSVLPDFPLLGETPTSEAQ